MFCSLPVMSVILLIEAPAANPFAAPDVELSAPAAVA